MSRKFKVKDLELQVVAPSSVDNKEASKVYNQAFNDALKSKAIVRARLDDILKEQGLWDDAKQAEYNKLQSSLLESERILKKGGITLARAKEVALQMKKDRETLRELISDRTSLDNHTAEGLFLILAQGIVNPVKGNGQVVLFGSRHILDGCCRIFVITGHQIKKGVRQDMVTAIFIQL